MTKTTERAETWSLIHTERAALADELSGLDDAAWRTPSLCEGWTVEDVVAHLTAGASLGRWAWLRSIAGARLDPDLHNARRLAEHRGATPAETLARFRGVATSTVAPSGHTAAWLGEVVVHGQDVRTPLGLSRTPRVAATTAVARFFATRDFTVSGCAVARGLRLEATDGRSRTATAPWSAAAPSRSSWCWQVGRRSATSSPATARRSCATASSRPRGASRRRGRRTPRTAGSA